ncbi:MAG: hypothetical protein DRQ88_04255 [Epsilonproteobacteria bacterium]|nr:MAG: hypothetical protein DRQ89_00470 [Campylobacterota bacterium]RLA67113.1 MAG: hypothetical protein DRQ88_04255 [Campylobacterota bacterium]
MGLLYILPVSKKEKDRINSDDNYITLKSYGLPPIFWLYLLGVLFIIGLMWFAIFDSIITLANTNDPLNVFLAYLVLGTLILTPTTLLFFFFYEKRVSKKEKTLTIGHYLLGLKLISKTYNLKEKDSFSVNHFLTSPNLARIKKDPSMRSFENHGYWELRAGLATEKNILVDRNNRKADLLKISQILSDY